MTGKSRRAPLLPRSEPSNTPATTPSDGAARMATNNITSAKADWADMATNMSTCLSAGASSM